METSVKQRLKEYIGSLGISTRRFEGNCGLSFGYIANLKSSPSADKITKILNAYPQINQEWLLTGEGEMLHSAPRSDVTKDTDTPMVRVPVLSLDARGGLDDNEEWGSEYYDGVVLWPNARDGDVALRVTGSSMAPVVPPGSLVLVYPDSEPLAYADHSRMYLVVLSDGRRLLKLLRSGPDESHITLHSYNPTSPDVSIPIASIVHLYPVRGYMVQC